MRQNKKDVDYNYTIFEYFAEQHNLTLLDGEINDIIHLVNSALITQLQAQGDDLQAAVNQYNAVVQQNKELQQDIRKKDNELTEVYMKLSAANSAASGMVELYEPFSDPYFEKLTMQEIAELAKKSIRLTKEHCSDLHKIEELQQKCKKLDEENQNLFNKGLELEGKIAVIKREYKAKGGKNE